MCTGQVGPTGRSVDSGAAEQARLRMRYLGSCCAFRAPWGQASVHAPAPWSRKSCLPVSTSQAPVNPPRPRPPPLRCRHTPPAVTACAYLPPCLPLPRESRTPALLGTSGAESEQPLRRSYYPEHGESGQQCPQGGSTFYGQGWTAGRPAPQWRGMPAQLLNPAGALHQHVCYEWASWK